MTTQTTHVVLQSDELLQLTGYRAPTKQLEVLHKRGFTRAFIGRRGVVLERAHFEAVCRGQIGKPAEKTANLAFMGARK